MTSWICEECGAHYEAAEPPDRCEYCSCKSFVDEAWQEPIEGPVALIDFGQPGTDWSPS